MIRRNSKLLRRLSSGAVAGLVVLALSGCLREDENVAVVFGPQGEVTVIPLGGPGIPAPPTASATTSQLELLSFDAAAIDAFGRATSRDATGQWPYWNLLFGGGEWGFGRTFGLEGFYVSEEDGRTPALSLSISDVAIDYLFMFMEGNAFGIGHNWFGELCCAPPGELFVIGLVRAGVEINGDDGTELDQTEVLLGNPIDEPDNIVNVGGSQGGDVGNFANKFGEIPAPSIGDNPYIIGTLMSCPTVPPYHPYDASCAAQGLPDGDIIIDWFFSSNDAAGNPIFPTSTTPTASNSPLAPNELARFSFPSYNYLYIWHTNPDGSPDFDNPLTRVQLGVDLSPLGGPINNAFAPFPTAALTDAEKALGNGAESRAVDVTMTASNLEELQDGAVFQAWTLDDQGSASSVEFTYTAPGGTPQPMTTSFTGGEGAHTLEFPFPEGATHAFLSIESSAGAGSPSAAQPFWTVGLQEAGTPKSLTLPTQFGTFGMNVTADQRPWAISGNGRGGFFGPEVRMRYEHLPRPPVGYKYVGWLVDGNGEATRLPDATFTSPPPSFTALTDADVDTEISPFVQPLEILEAMTRFCVTPRQSGADCAAPFPIAPQNETFMLTLEPKDGAADQPAPTVMLQGALPER